MQGCTIAFIWHGDDATLRVDEPGADTSILRIHIPIAAATGTHVADPKAMNSERLWLETLSQDIDLVLRKPARNRAGELATRVPVDAANEPVNCTLLYRLPGGPCRRDPESEYPASWIRRTITATRRSQNGGRPSRVASSRMFRLQDGRPSTACAEMDAVLTNSGGARWNPRSKGVQHWNRSS